MKLGLYQQVDILFSILEELLNSPFNKQFDDKAKRVLSKYGLEVAEGKIVKSQRRISAEAKETGYDESEDEKVINEIINTIKGNHPTHSSKEIQKMVDWLENIPYTIDHEKREGFQLGYKAGLEKQVQKSIDWLKLFKQRIGG